MAKVIESQGQYTVKSSGEVVNYEYSYVAFDNLNDAIEALTEAEVLKRVQRMTKVDANNTAREKAKTENGHSTRPVMSEEAKAQAKVERQANKSLLDRIKAKAKESGMSVEDVLASL